MGQRICAPEPIGRDSFRWAMQIDMVFLSQTVSLLTSTAGCSFMLAVFLLSSIPERIGPREKVTSLIPVFLTPSFCDSEVF